MSAQFFRIGLAIAISLVAMFVLLGQVRKPWRGIGQLFIWIMRVRHASVTKWGLGHVAVEKDYAILDIGCGSGAAIREMAQLGEQGSVSGIDYSAASVAAARRFNAELIASGRVNVQQASVSHLPFADNSFDLVTAVETHYYWLRPVEDFQEVLRVIKPGGRLVVIAEQYKGERNQEFFSVAMKLVRATYFSVRETEELFVSAGFTDVNITVEPNKGWLAGTGRKPEVKSR